eukprot:gnl/MRDRNA2_/MRDRNA2_56090_c0_seq1.p1 gnl/MRDRNA2_/MRDRNA2_56090_c0~~gnl/MRDRNA2_/MRDRNA2_56090_c0_seq1.p1  ORF type:complete len:1290 (-),score=167.75 gnl/MRDRNA2_/MRDRNA2_56090_c0_seq1:153-3836(-)
MVADELMMSKGNFFKRHSGGSITGGFGSSNFSMGLTSTDRYGWKTLVKDPDRPKSPQLRPPPNQAQATFHGIGLLGSRPLRTSASEGALPQLLGNGHGRMLSQTGQNDFGESLRNESMPRISPAWSRNRRRERSGSQIDSLPSLETSYRHGQSSSSSSFADTGAALRKADSSMHAHASPRDDVEKRDSAQDRYLKVCLRTGILPIVVPFVTGHSTALNVTARDLVDDDLKALATVVRRGHERIDGVNLANNALLTDTSLVPFLLKLVGPPASETLVQLSLGKCVKAGTGTCKVIIDLLAGSFPLQALRSLDVSGLTIPSQLQLQVCTAIARHTGLEYLNLADTGLGVNYASLDCVAKILDSGKIKELDISWNSFHGAVFEHIAEHMSTNTVLCKLGIANCNGATPARSAGPIAFFLEGLSSNKYLTELDVSMNRMDFRSALVLENGLAYHKRLKELIISDNPLGVAGMRCLLRLLCRNTSGLVHFKCFNCATAGEDTTAGNMPSGQPYFNATDPSGRYSLDLALPYHRALLRMLYDSCERFGFKPEDMFKDLHYSLGGGVKKRVDDGRADKGDPYSHPPGRDALGVWDVVRKGHLTFTFSLAEVLNRQVQETPWKSDFTHAGEFIERHFLEMRIQPANRKVVPLCFQWKTLATEEQCVFLDSLSRDFLLSYPHIDVLCRCRSQVKEVLAKLTHCIAGGEIQRFMVFQLVPDLGTFLNVRRDIDCLLRFNVENPTGHYVLELDKASEYAVAELLLLLDSWEAALSRKQKRVDCSQRGNESHVRNEFYQGQPLSIQGNITGVAEWCIPMRGVLEMDYSSGRRPFAHVEPVDMRCWDAILKIIQDSEVSASDKAAVLQMVSSSFYITVLQFREILGCFRENARVEVFMIFIFRLSDVCNEKACRARIADEDEWCTLRHRLGFVALFPFIQPENMTFKLDFAVWEQRVVAYLLFQLCSREGRQNLRDPVYHLPDGTRDPLSGGIPMRWFYSVESVPNGGKFQITYTCDPDSCAFGLRKELAHMYGGWNIKGSKGQVMWWTSLTEATDDVLALVRFLLPRYVNFDKVFTLIDGPGGNGQINLREFEEGIANLSIASLMEHPGQITNVFRWLDPGGEGRISRSEWGVLQQVARELQLSIQEFVRFLKRQFTGNSIVKAWEVLDDDGSGSIDIDEWEENVSGKLKYLGPCMAIFHYLDKDGEGSIERDEWDTLEQVYQEIVKQMDEWTEPDVEE